MVNILSAGEKQKPVEILLANVIKFPNLTSLNNDLRTSMDEKQNDEINSALLVISSGHNYWAFTEYMVKNGAGFGQGLDDVTHQGVMSRSVRPFMGPCQQSVGFFSISVASLNPFENEKCCSKFLAKNVSQPVTGTKDTHGLSSVDDVRNVIRMFQGIGEYNYNSAGIAGTLLDHGSPALLALSAISTGTFKRGSISKQAKVAMPPGFHLGDMRGFDLRMKFGVYRGTENEERTVSIVEVISLLEMLVCMIISSNGDMTAGFVAFYNHFLNNHSDYGSPVGLALEPATLDRFLLDAGKHTRDSWRTTLLSMANSSG